MDDDGVTPVVGTVMILGITILGIGAIMLWGAPTLQAIQDRNAVVAMEGEFIEIRAGTLDLMIDKSSRVPEVVIGAGVLKIEDGSRFLVTSEQFHGVDPGDTLGYYDCDFILTDWDDSDGSFLLQDSGCTGYDSQPVGDCATTSAGRFCLQVASVSGSNEDDEVLTLDGASGGSWAYTLSGADLSQGDWVFRLYDDNDELAAQAWLLGTARLRWDLASTSGDYGVYLEGGSVFESQGIRSFLIKGAAIQEDSSGANDYFMRLPTYIASEFSSVSGPGSANVFIGQVGNNHVRIQSDATEEVRFSVSGELSEAWCRSLLARNNQITDASYAQATPDACNDDIASIVYAMDDTAADFPFELSHARITTRIQF